MTLEPELIEENIEEYLARQEQKELMRFLTCGSVDDGKSTLIGRLLHDSKLIYEDQLNAIKQASSRRGLADGGLDLSLLLDGLAAEREQGITIDVAYRYFSTSKRKFIIADTPGHEQYTRNMATGASNCDLAVILVDARKGVLAQTRRHSFIVSLLGIRHLVVAVNKMDLVEYSEEVFETIKRDYTDFAAVLGVDDVHFVPLSALNGDNVVDESENMPWYQGGALLPYLESVYIAADRNMSELRMPVQWVSRPDANFRGFAGSIASGVLRPGDDILVLPTGTTSRVKSIVTFDGEMEEAWPPQAITVTLEDEIDISRGDMIVSPEDRPRVERDFDAFVVWMSEDAMRPGTQYLFKQTHNLVRGTIASCRYAIDVNTLQQHEAETLALNEIGRCQVSLNRAIPLDAYRNNRTTGAFIIIDRITNNTVGAGVVIDHFASDEPRSLWEAEAPSELLQRKTSSVTAEERHNRFGQLPATVLLTGLTASGKSTVAYALERRLFDAGHAAAVLDGETMRLGISKDLGFSLAERSENLRRAAEVARMQNEAGLITICAFVAPDRESREQTRQMIGDERFVEVYLSAPVEVCRERDTHGMYARADSGEIEHFPGVTEPYEAPEAPDLELPTHVLDVDACVDLLMRLLEQRGYLR